MRERSSTYRAWEGLKARCNQANHPRYADWGGRGITYDPKWETYAGFLEDMGEAPAGETLDRKDNDKGYCKENCRWATYSQQNFNRRLPKNNISGVKGVAWMAGKQIWYASAKKDRRSFNLYMGPDFFKAICARKSWELRNT
jgi:hypothetical protein